MKLAPNTYRPWLLYQDEIWISRDGKVRKIDDIDREYAVNLIAFLLRDPRGLLPELKVRTPLVRRLLARSARP